MIDKNGVRSDMMLLHAFLTRQLEFITFIDDKEMME